MTNFDTIDKLNTSFVPLSDQELMETEGGSWELAAAIVAVGWGIYQIGEALGKSIYYMTH